MPAGAPALLDSPPVVQCPVCKADRTRRTFVARDPHYGIAGAWQIRECGDCDSLFVENIPSEESLTRMYPDTYYSFAIPQRARWKRMLRRLLGYQSLPRDPVFPVGTRMLDFGCGAGEWLLERRAEGMAVFGVEPF